MKPLSKRLRAIYFYTAVGLFLILSPLLVLYSMGYRWGDLKRFTHTGGIYVQTNESGVEIYVDKKLRDTGSLFGRDAFVHDLTPGQHLVIAAKEGYFSWGKVVNVPADKVVEVHAYIFPQKSQSLRLITSNVVSGDERLISETEYQRIKTLFVNIPTLITQTYKDVVIDPTTDPNILHISWQGSDWSLPYYFCNISSCEKSFDLLVPRMQYFDFFPASRELMIAKLDNGIYAVELDRRGNQNIFPLFSDAQADFVVDNNETIYVKSHGEFYLLDY